MTKKLLRKTEVIKATGLCGSMIYRLMKEQKFPKSVPITPGRVGWVDSEVEAWITAKIADRDSKAA